MLRACSLRCDLQTLRQLTRVSHAWGQRARAALRSPEWRALQVRVRRIADCVGPKPAGRTWKDEWVAMWLERDKMNDDSDPASLYEAGGDCSVEVVLRDLAADIEATVALGWPRQHAEAYLLIGGCVGAPLAAAVAERSPRYAAATHAVCAALAAAGARQAEPAPLCYTNLTGLFGLATSDPAWKALLRDDAAPGTSFVTNGCTSPWDDARNFPEDGGDFHDLVDYGERGLKHRPIDSEVVAFRSAPADGDLLRSLIQETDTEYALPPLATVTLEQVQEAGEWRAHGKTIKHRLLTVSVAYRR